MLPNQLCDNFLTWQCRIRQIAMREDGGRPSQGMMPQVFDTGGTEISPGIITLLIRENSSESTEFLKFQVQKHNDPQDVYKKSLTYLQSTHYHRAIEFSDELTAVFAEGSSVAEKLLSAGQCVLRFSEYSQIYSLTCKVRSLINLEPAYEASYWHNKVFNPNLGTAITILGFQPDWDQATLSQMS